MHGSYGIKDYVLTNVKMANWHNTSSKIIYHYFFICTVNRVEDYAADISIFL